MNKLRRAKIMNELTIQTFSLTSSFRNFQPCFGVSFANKHKVALIVVGVAKFFFYLSDVIQLGTGTPYPGYFVVVVTWYALLCSRLVSEYGFD